MRSFSKAVYAICVCIFVIGCGGGTKNSNPPDDDGDGVANASDCAPIDRSRWQLISYQAIDADSDSHPVNAQGQLCSGANLPSGYYAAAIAAADADCDDSNAALWHLLTYASVDQDRDEHRTIATGNVCSGTTLPTGYSSSIPTQLEHDCNDSDSTVWRYATVYSDRDGDGVGSGNGVIICIGASAPSGYSLAGYDPLDDATDSNSMSVSDFDIPPALLNSP
ncbi:MAG: hypothetical protein QM808_11310 [Steroidobacteraceae bacterium]